MNKVIVAILIMVAVGVHAKLGAEHLAARSASTLTTGILKDFLHNPDIIFI